MGISGVFAAMSRSGAVAPRPLRRQRGERMRHPRLAVCSLSWGPAVDSRGEDTDGLGHPGERPGTAEGHEAGGGASTGSRGAAPGDRKPRKVAPMGTSIDPGTHRVDYGQEPGTRGWAMFRLDAQGRLLSVDDASPPLLPAVFGTNADGILSAQGVPEMRRMLEAAARGQEPPVIHLDVKGPTGETVAVQVVVRCVRRLDGSLEVVEGMAWDATTERDERDVFQALTESSPVGIYVVQNGAFVFVNARMSRFTGYADRELLGKASVLLIHEDDREDVRKHAVAMLKGEEASAYQYRSVTRSGAICWVLESVAPVQYRGQRAVLGNYMDITLMKHMEEEVGRGAHRDPLTGLPNRTALADRLDEALARPGAAVGALFMDLDDFKDVNDRHGHAVGDELLQVVSSRISHAVRPGDVVARVGGDEFVIIAEGASASDLAAIARRIIVAASTPCRIRGSLVAVGASVGIAMSSGGSEGADHLLARADAAMYRAKATGNHYAADHEGAEQVA